jgi:hypothetical protein
MRPYRARPSREKTKMADKAYDVVVTNADNEILSTTRVYAESKPYCTVTVTPVIDFGEFDSNGITLDTVYFTNREFIAIVKSIPSEFRVQYVYGNTDGDWTRQTAKDWLKLHDIYYPD